MYFTIASMMLGSKPSVWPLFIRITSIRRARLCTLQIRRLAQCRDARSCPMTGARLIGGCDVPAIISTTSSLRARCRSCSALPIPRFGGCRAARFEFADGEDMEKSHVKGGVVAAGAPLQSVAVRHRHGHPITNEAIDLILEVLVAHDAARACALRVPQ